MTVREWAEAWARARGGWIVEDARVPIGIVVLALDGAVRVHPASADRSLAENGRPIPAADVLRKRA